MCKLKLNSTMANLVLDVIAITPVYKHTTVVVGMSWSKCPVKAKEDHNLNEICLRKAIKCSHLNLMFGVCV